MKLVLVFAVILGCVSAASLGRRREHYRGNQLLRITAENEEDVKWLKTLEGTSSGTLDFWSKSAGGRTVDVMVSEGYVREFNQMLDRRDLSYRVLMTDVQEHVDEEYEHAMRTSMASRSKRDVSFDYTVYHKYDEVGDRSLKATVKLCNGQVLSRTTYWCRSGSWKTHLFAHGGMGRFRTNSSK